MSCYFNYYKIAYLPDRHNLCLQSVPEVVDNTSSVLDSVFLRLRLFSDKQLQGSI